MEPQEVKVLTTNNYDMFSFLMNNREQTKGHINNLKEEIEKRGNITQSQPILVNEHMQIIDGQHRFTACQELGLPIYYIIAQGAGIEDARSMNILHKSWGPDDYARSYAMSGDVNYQRYLVLREDYGFSHSILLFFILHNEQGMYAVFRKGEMVIRDEEDVVKKLDRFTELLEALGINNPDRNLALAFLAFDKQEIYDHRRMVEKARAVGSRYIRRFATTDDYKRALEQVYNHSVAERNRVRLY